MRRTLTGLALLLVLAVAPPPASAAKLANRCVAVPGAGRLFFEPTAVRTYMLLRRNGKLVGASAPGPDAEWTVRRRPQRRFAIRSKASGRPLTKKPVRLRRARGCRRYPEARLGARGKPFRSARLFGFADPHLHITADLRAGGQVISGAPFDRFGITEALGDDAEVHGPDGSLDTTGNLLRGGSPTGTHDTSGWPRFAGWPTSDTYTHQQVYWRWLQRAWLGGLRLVVAQTVEDEPLCEIEPRRSHSCDEMDTVELEVKELRALQRYVDAQAGGRGRGFFRLVYGPRQARRAIARGKLAVVIGAESSDPFGCSQQLGRPNCDRAAIDRGIARMRKLGVRSMFVAHWVDNALAGAALEGGDKGTFIGAMQLQQTGAPFETGDCPHPGQGEEMPPLPGRRCNVKGLTELGAYAVRKLMDAHMLIEADHMSERARDDVLAIAEERGYPLVSSHTGTGGAWDESELRRLHSVGGFASATLDDAPKLPDKVLGLRRYGAGVGLSTDTGGFAALPGPDAERPLAYPFRSFRGGVRFSRQRTGRRTFDVNTDGVAHYGLIPDLLAKVRAEPRGKRALGVLFRSAGAYVRTWERAVRR